jgi:hypothetical protein
MACICSNSRRCAFSALIAALLFLIFGKPIIAQLIRVPSFLETSGCKFANSTPIIFSSDSTSAVVQGASLFISDCASVTLSLCAFTNSNVTFQNSSFKGDSTSVIIFIQTKTCRVILFAYIILYLSYPLSTPMSCLILWTCYPFRRFLRYNHPLIGIMAKEIFHPASSYLIWILCVYLREEGLAHSTTCALPATLCQTWFD